MDRWSFDAPRFMEFVAEKMSAVVPEGVAIESDGEMLWYVYEGTPAYGGGRSGSYFRTFLQDGGRATEKPSRELAAGACQLAFDQLQDFVVEKTGSPWPGVKRMPSSHAEMIEGRVHVWFSEEGEGDIDLGWIDVP